MAATKQDIERWFDIGQRGMKHTHMVIVCDEFEVAWEDYPVYTNDPKKTVDTMDGNNMQRVVEVYDLTRPKEPQLAESRAMNF